MKKIVTLLLSALFLYGCGGGSGSGQNAGVPSTGTPAGTPISSKVGSITLKLADSATSSTAKQVDSLTTPATWGRVVVRQFQTVPTQVPIFNYDPDTGDPIPTGTFQTVYSYTETYRRVVNAAINTSNQISFQTPISNLADPNDTYQFDVLTYLPGTPNTMVKFATTGSAPAGLVSVQDGTSLTMTLADVNDGSATYVLPTSIKADNLYSLKVTTSRPLRNTYGFEFSTASIPALGTFLNTYYSGMALTATGPKDAPLTDALVYFHFKFYIADDMLNKDDKTDVYTKWVRFVPSAGSSTGEINTNSIYFAPLATATTPGI